MRADGELHAEHSRCVQANLTTPAECVDHVDGHARADDRQTFYDEARLQSLCMTCNRLKAIDNRNVPERKLTPHVIYHPSDNRWFALKIARNAEPLSASVGASHNPVSFPASNSRVSAGSVDHVRAASSSAICNFSLEYRAPFFRNVAEMQTDAATRSSSHSNPQITQISLFADVVGRHHATAGTHIGQFSVGQEREC